MKKYRKKMIAGILLCVILSATTVLFWRFHNGVKLWSETDYKVMETVVRYRQDDKDWAQKLLGESQYTMESSGCLVSCIAAAVTMNGKTMSPGMLNELFTESDVYDAEGNIQWDKINELENYYAEIYSEVNNIIIEECLDSGKYPIVRVRMHGLGNFHYVLVVGAEEGEYLCMDPLEDELTKLSDYGSRVYAIRCVWYNMPEVDEVHGQGIEVCVKQAEYGRYWYADEESFLKGFGFDKAEPFYEYRDEECFLRLSLYFEEQTGEGCGVRYVGNNGERLYGFTFNDTKKEEWTGFLTDYSKQLSSEDTTGKSAVEEYKEEYEYDELGRITRFQSTGILPELVEEGMDEPQNVLCMEYEYHTNGNLKSRHYHHSPWIFATTFSVWDSYFDELGRVEYESAYITHGSIEYFYLYTGYEETPKYVLILDDYLGSLIPEFTCY